MISLGLALAAAGTTAVDAERAFAAAAQTQGQNTAFRAYAAPEAIMFTPEAGNAQAFLKDKPDPPVSVMWWPGRSWVSCDGTLAVNSGPWIARGGRGTGTFTTVWRRQPDGGWKWLLDHGRTTPKPVAAADRPVTIRPACGARGRTNSPILVQFEDQLPRDTLPKLAIEEGPAIASGASDDKSLQWEVRSVAGGEKGAHTMRVTQWDGTKQRIVLFELSGVSVK